MRRTCLALVLAPIALVLVACNDTGKKPGQTFSHLDGVRVTVRESDQPFTYFFSVTALAALGDDVREGLKRVGYERSRTLWDEGFDTAIQSAVFDDANLLELAPVAAVQAASGGTFLTAKQTEALKTYVDRVLAGTWPLTKDRKFENGQELARPSIVSASMLQWLVRSLRYRERDAHQFLKRIEGDLVGAQIACTPDVWRSEEGAIVSERLAASLGLACEPGAIRSAWEAVVSRLEEADFDSGFGSTHEFEQLSIAMMVSEGVPNLFDASDRARVQAVVDKVMPRFSSDGYDWLYGYLWFAERATTYRVELTEAATEILVHIASHGAVPELEIHR